ncbi:hypothetical protein [Gabonia massiliensis]|uniref:hypothetical protein n=1 Tax=Gabonia massiliensis TaxID=1686296 RepID=UPI0006D7CE1A|nr:hypothetical protein [Gabonia massiliensis]
MVTYCILTGLLVYYIALWLWYRHADNRRSEKGTNDKTVPESQADGYTLIGESRYKGGLIGTVQDKSGHLPQAVENDTIFTPQAAGKPEESVFETLPEEDGTPDYEDEEIAGYMDGDDDTGRAAGVSFEELGEAVRTANADNSTEAEQRQAAGTLARIEGTNLYDAVVENINGGLARVAELLKRNEAGLVTATVPTGATPPASEEYESFNMNDFL